MGLLIDKWLHKADDREWHSSCAYWSDKRCPHYGFDYKLHKWGFRLMDDVPQRMACFVPKSDNNDQRLGAVRWPGAVR